MSGLLGGLLCLRDHIRSLRVYIYIYIILGVPGIKWAGKDGKEFGNPTEELLGKQFKHHLQNHKTQFKVLNIYIYIYI